MLLSSTQSVSASVEDETNFCKNGDIHVAEQHTVMCMRKCEADAVPTLYAWLEAREAR